MIITALNYNDFYYEQLKVMLTSLSINSPREYATIHLVNFPSAEIKKLKMKFLNYSFINKVVDFNQEDSIPGYMVCYRARVVYEHLLNGKEPVAWFDTDLIIRKDLSPAWEDLDGNQFKILNRNTPDKDCKFQAGIFFVGYSQETLDLISDWEEITVKENKWFADQKNLYLMYEKHSDKVKLIKMDKKFNDVGCSKNPCFLKDSYIWHCKKKHFNRSPFREEYLYYLEKFNSI